MIKNIITALKGFLMGAANVIPGVSGGTIALLTGIYHEIIDSLNSLMERQTWSDLLHGRMSGFWSQIHGTFLTSLGIGVVASILSLAKLMKYLLSNCPVQTWAFFFGLIAASSAIMFRGIKNWKLKDVILALAGLILGVVVCTLSPTETPDKGWFIFICGAIAICTMILPGISGSFILVVLSKYDYIMNAVAELDIPVLAVFAAGCLIGILAFSKFLHWLLKRGERETMLVLLGFVVGSLVKVWPWADRAAIEASQGVSPGGAVDLHIAAAVLWCVIGAASVAAIELLASRHKTPESISK